MFINGKDLKEFKGKLVSMDIGIASKSIEKKFLSNNSLKAITTKNSNYKFIPISLVIEIEALSRDEFETLKSKLASELDECILSFEDILDKEYEAWTSSEIICKKEMPQIGELTVALMAICESSEVTYTFTSLIKIKNNGTSDSPARILVLPEIALSNLTITGLTDNPITVKSVTTNAPLIIDGIKGLVTQNGINKFGDTDLWQFPVVKPGINNITLSTSVKSAVLTYKPRFV